MHQLHHPFENWKRQTQEEFLMNSRLGKTWEMIEYNCVILKAA